MTPSATPLPVVADCWNAIGIQGDATCPELSRFIHCRNCPVFADAGRRLYDREPPAGYIDEWTAAIADAEPVPPGRSIPVILFQVADEVLAIDVAHTVEVTPLRTIRRVPHQGDSVLLGLVDIRGELQLAISPRALLGVGEPGSRHTESDKARLLVIERDGLRWVLVVDEVFDILHFAEDDVGGIPATVGAGHEVFARGVFRWRDRAVGYLDPDRLFTALRRNFR